MNAQTSLSVQQFNINGDIYQIEIAQTPQQLQMGLMGRTSLAKNQGMLFRFPAIRYHGIWMKNMTIGLTVGWLDRQLRVVDVQKLRPCQQLKCPIYKSKKLSSYVIELNENNDLAIGDQLLIVKTH